MVCLFIALPPINCVDGIYGAETPTEKKGVVQSDSIDLNIVSLSRMILVFDALKHLTLINHRSIIYNIARKDQTACPITEPKGATRDSIQFALS